MQMERGIHEGLLIACIILQFVADSVGLGREAGGLGRRGESKARFKSAVLARE